MRAIGLERERERNGGKEEERSYLGLMRGSVAPLDVAGGALQIPWHFRCPISLELMRDPVTVSTGQTYDRPSIESWVATGNTTCPVTRAPLPDFTLIPNHTLRRLIQEWCVAHRAHGVERIPTPKQPADPSLVRSLVSTAAGGPVPDRAAALRRLRALARESDKNRAVVSSRETRSALISIAFEENVDPDLEFESHALLSMLPLSESESGMITERPGRIERLANVLATHPSFDARINAAAVIESVAAGSRSAEVRAEIGAVDGVIDGLVSLVEHRGGYMRAVRVGIRGIFSLCLAKENRGRAVAAGAAAAVIGRVGELVGGDAERALATVELLCRAESGREAVVAGAGGGEAAVGVLVRAMAGKASERAAEHAVGALVAVVGGSEELQREAAEAGVVPLLLVMVQGGCSERAKRKAQVLLKLLRAAWPHRCCFGYSDDFIQPF